MPVNKTCELCGKAFVDRSDTQHGRFCSRACRLRASYQSHLEERREYARAWGKNNRDKKREYDRVYREANREKIREYMRAYEGNDREERLKKRKVYRETNRELLRDKYRAWRGANLEKARELTRAWAQANPEKVRELGARRRAREVGAFVARVDREAIYKRDNYTCQLCKKKVQMDKKAPHPLSPSIDHILPLSKGGTHEPKNAQLAHLLCNSRKSASGVDQLRLFGE